MKQNFLYSVEREYETNLDTMWNAWTDSASLESWYFPAGLTAVRGAFASEAEVGGRWTVAVDVAAYGFVAYFWGRYLKVEPKRHLTHTMSYSQSLDEFNDRSDDAPAHRVEVEFEQRGDRAWVRFSQYGELPEDQIEATKAGMGSYFDSLGAFLSR